MKDNHIIKQDSKPNYYIYRINTTSHIQIGFLAITNIQSFISNKIKGHELTYERRAQERANQMLNIETQIGPIYVFYKDNEELVDEKIYWFDYHKSDFPHQHPRWEAIKVDLEVVDN